MIGALKGKTFSASSLKITILVIVASLVLYRMDAPFLHFMELKALDLRFIDRGSLAPGGETIIAAIDEKSVTELGQWPWPRTVIARLIEALREYGARSIGFDIVFAEPARNESLEALEELSRKVDDSGLKVPGLLQFVDEKRAEADSDLVLASSMARAGNVTLGYFFHTSESEARHLTPEDVERGEESIGGSRYGVVRTRGTPGKTPVTDAYAAVPNIPSLTSAGETSGFFNTFPDADGTNRWFPMAIRFKGNYYPPLSIAVLRQYLDWPTLSLKMAEYGVEGIRIDEIEIPTDERGRVLINFLGPPETFPHYSITDIVHRRVDPMLFRDKIVLVGATATGICDLKVTPFSTVYPGVGIHATVIDNILHQNFIKRPGWTALIDGMVIILVGFIIGMIASRAGAVRGLLVSVAVMTAWVLINRFIFSSYNLWLNIVYPLATILTVYVGVTIYRYVTEEREKKRIRGAFQHYLNVSVINEILKDPSKLTLGGKRKNLSVLFSDVRDFTTVSEQLTPEELVHLLNEYLTAMTEVVFRYDGLLDKYIGDAIMAVFGAPLDQTDHPKKACLTAVGMMEALEKLQKKWRGEGKPVLDIGIGINSGDMVVGNMGSEMRFDYTVVGDSVNLGSRLEGINKEYGTNIVMSEFTYEQVKDTFFCRQLGSVRVKGKAVPVKIYELLGEGKDSEQWDGFVKVFEEGLAWYTGCRWDEAIACFQKAEEIRNGDPPSRVYMERCRKLRETHLGDGWDGIYTMTEK